MEKGWTRQFEAAEPRLSEAVGLYEEMGLEVRLEPLDVCAEEAPGHDCDSCRACFLGIEDRYRVIFTRKRKPSGEGANPSD